MMNNFEITKDNYEKYIELYNAKRELNISNKELRNIIKINAFSIPLS